MHFFATLETNGRVRLLHEASLHVKSDRFLALNNSALKVVSRKNWIIRITHR